MRTFSARETEWLQELDGIELASFWQRAIAITIDSVFIVIILSIVGVLAVGAVLGVRHLEGKPMPLNTNQPLVTQDDANRLIDQGELPHGLKYKVQASKEDESTHIVNDVLVPVLYFGILLWKGKGQTPGKRIMKIRVVSIMHRHLTFWHSIERALGYGAAALEAGFGFIQFFIHPYRRCAQDRLAETIVVTERSYLALQHRLSHPLIPDTNRADVISDGSIASPASDLNTSAHPL